MRHPFTSHCYALTCWALAAFATLMLGARPTLAVPPNDNCTSPTAISGNGSFPFVLIGATFSPEGQDQCDPLPGGPAFENDVWFCWTANCNGLVDINTCGTGIDTKIALYANGCTCPTPPPSNPPLCCNDDVFVAGCDVESRIRCEVQCDHQYLIRVGTKPGANPGNGNLSINCLGTPCTPPPVCEACCGKRPNFITLAGFNGGVAAMTQESGVNTRVLDFVNIGAPQPATGSLINWNAPFYNPTAAQNWTQANLGTVFGVTFDNLGNTYVSHSTVFSPSWGGGDAIGGIAGGAAGAIYKIDTNTGVPSVFAVLPNNAITGCAGSECWPGLGNVCFSCAHNQFYVSNHEDGRIYRLDTGGITQSTWKHATGTLMVGAGLDPFDTNGFSPLQPHPTTLRGQRTWGVQVHNGRLYYGVWREDSGRQDPAHNNEVWSVALTAGGEFIPGTEQLEITQPNLPQGPYTNPASDIAFRPNTCCMLLAERSMIDNTSSYAHESRLLEYCQSATGAWTPSGNTFQMGSFLVNSSAGGCDYDHHTGAGINVNVWGTGDAIKLWDPPTGTDPAIYGLGGMTFTGTNPYLNGLMIDADQVTSIGDKFMQGCVDISCPAPNPPICEPLPDGSGCYQVTCDGPVLELCRPKCVLIGLDGVARVSECDCRTQDECHITLGAGGVPTCVGVCPQGKTCFTRVTPTPDGTLYCCECVDDPPACEPAPDGQSCKPFACPTPGESCRPRCVRFGPTGPMITECDCRGPNECYVMFAAGSEPHCVGNCPVGQTCVTNLVQNSDGTFTICCDCVNQICECPGDVNGDGILNGLDIQGFVRCMTGTPLPTDNCACADVNGDGVRDQADIALLIQRILTKANCGNTPCCPKQNLSLNLASGVYDGGGIIPVGQNDDTWSVVVDPSGGTVPRPATVIAAHPAWTTIPGTQWISAAATGPNGTYEYEFCFCLDPRYRNPQLNMQVIADDSGQVYLNGNFLGNTGPYSGPPANISTNNPAFFQPGNNCIRIVVQNLGGVVTGVNFLASVSALDAKCCCPPRDLVKSIDTGVDDTTNTVIPYGNNDDTWTVTVDAAGGTVPRPATVITAHPAWLTIPGTRWISAAATGPNGLYVYQYCFCLDPRFSNPVLNMDIRADDYCEVWLNGSMIGATPNGWAFNTPQPTKVIATNPALFKACQNCIELRCINGGGVVTGVNVKATITATNGRCCDDPPRSCCLPNGDCVDLAPGTTQCPNGATPFEGPCGNSSPCCLPDGTCSVISRACCLQAGGTVLPDTVKCGGVVQACCIQNAAGGPTQCLMVSPACCKNIHHGTPMGAGSTCLGDLNGNGVDDACEETQACHVNPATGYCNPTVCPVPGQECLPTCALVDSATGVFIQMYNCDCRSVQDCHLTLSATVPGVPPSIICVPGNCPPGTTCQTVTTPLGNGTSKVCCECVPNPPPVCEPDPLAIGCRPTTCPTAGDVCRPTCVRIQGGTNQVIAVVECNCMSDTACHIEWDANFANPHCVGSCPPGMQCNTVFTVNPDGTQNMCCRCEPITTSTCPLSTDLGSQLCATLQNQFCQSPVPTTSTCRPTLVTTNGQGQGITVQACSCIDPGSCGALDIQQIGPGNYAVTCMGSCSPANPSWTCYLHINGQPAGTTTVNTNSLPPGTTLQCRCAP